MNTKEFIASGILELYVLGQSTEEENAEVELMMEKHPEVSLEIREIQTVLENHALENSIEPDPTIRPLLLATINYIQRLESGEAMSFPPVLNENSKIEDYREWIDKEYMEAPEYFEEIHVNLISATPQMTCAIVWLKNMAPDEVHKDEHEKFLILEGTCSIFVGTQENKLVPGDYFQIPLHEDHRVIVTSDIPCKVILQRVAA
jgi:mannose-6-phosphate isomerase-like protein (cupin superfamily)